MYYFSCFWSCQRVSQCLETVAMKGTRTLLKYFSLPILCTLYASPMCVFSQLNYFSSFFTFFSALLFHSPFLLLLPLPLFIWLSVQKLLSARVLLLVQDWGMIGPSFLSAVPVGQVRYMFNVCTMISDWVLMVLWCNLGCNLSVNHKWCNWNVLKLFHGQCYVSLCNWRIFWRK